MRSLMKLLCSTLILGLAGLACKQEAPPPKPAAKTPGLIESAPAEKARTTPAVSPARKTPTPAAPAQPTTAPAALKATPTAGPVARIPTPLALSQMTTAPAKAAPTSAPEVVKTPVPAPTATPAPTPETKNRVVVMKTGLGTIEIELDPVHAPLSTQNFLYYVQSHHYDGTVFHRVIPTFMIQGGGFTPDMVEKPTAPPIKNETPNGLSNQRGTIAMARTSQPDSATCQFFINVGDNLTLDASRYAVFGKVISGMDVVDKIRAVPTHGVTLPNGQPFENVPIQPVIIESVTVKQ